MNENVGIWLEFTREDLLAAKKLTEAGLYNLICFHAQQCAEKSLKAVIASYGLAPPKLHSITELCQRAEISLSPEDLDKIHGLDAFYIPSRYPDALPGMKAEGLPGKEDAREALETAETIFSLVKTLLYGYMKIKRKIFRIQCPRKDIATGKQVVIGESVSIQ